jgi:hypothetical protein
MPVLRLCAPPDGLGKAAVLSVSRIAKSAGVCTSAPRGRSFEPRSSCATPWSVTGAAARRSRSITYGLVDGGQALDETNAVASCLRCNFRRGAENEPRGAFLERGLALTSAIRSGGGAREVVSILQTIVRTAGGGYAGVEDGEGTAATPPRFFGRIRSRGLTEYGNSTTPTR